MSGTSSEPAYLDDGGTISFRDVGHFEAEVEANLLRGRALVRTRRSLGMNQSLRLRIIAPNEAGEAALSGRVVFVQNDVVGFQITDLDDAKRSSLRQLVGWSKDPASKPTPPPPPAAAPAAPAPAAPGPAAPTGTIDVRAAREQAPSADLPDADAPPVAPAPRSTKEQLAARWPTVDAEGVVVLEDEAVALALYLFALRCGRVVLQVASEAAAPARARFQLGSRSAELTLIPMSSTDGVGLFRVDDPLPLAELVQDSGPALAPLLTGVGLCATGDLPSTGDVDRPRTADIPAPEPVPPRLEGDTVVFERSSDLARELETNVINGGLFVESPPIPLRERKELRVRVGGRALPVTLAADVVFADGGRVGFSLSDAQRARDDLEKAARRSREVPASGDTPPLDVRAGGTTTLDIRVGTEDVVPPFSGQVAPPLPTERLLDLQRATIRDASDLARAATLQVFEYIVRCGWTGVLRIRADAGERDVHFYRGDVAFVAARPFEEHTSLGRILVAHRKVNETQLREALDRSKGSHRLLGRMLVLLGALKRKDLSSALREQTRAKMQSAFDWRSGRYEWGPWVEPPGEADLVVTGGISVLEYHLRQRFDELPFGELETLLEPSLGRVVTPTDLDVLSTSLRLSPRELRFIELQLDGTRSIHDAVMGSPLGRLGSLRLVAVGLALGVLQLEGTAGVDVTPAPSDDLRTRTKTAADELRSRLERRLREIEAASHFDVLGVHWSSHHRDYRTAWETARKEFDLQKPPLSDASDAVKKIAKDILRKIDLAKETLEQKDKRIAYRKDLFDKTERQYAAEMLLKQGEVALMRGDRGAALEALETAAELYPTAKVLELLNTARGR